MHYTVHIHYTVHASKTDQMCVTSNELSNKNIHTHRTSVSAKIHLVLLLTNYNDFVKSTEPNHGVNKMNNLILVCQNIYIVINQILQNT